MFDSFIKGIVKALLLVDNSYISKSTGSWVVDFSAAQTKQFESRDHIVPMI